MAQKPTTSTTTFRNNRWLMSVLPTASRYCKSVLGGTVIGPPLRNWYRQVQAVNDLGNWTATDSAALRFYSQFLAPGQLCFDIGANRGLRTKVYRRLGARVVAVEPQSSCMKILRGAYARDPDVVLVPAACGSAVGSGFMRVCEADVLSSLSDEWISAVHSSGRFTARWEKQEPCSLLTVDVLAERYGSPVFIKIDVEGYELNVLQGMTRAVPSLSFEFTPERFASAVECLDYLRGLGFDRFNVSWAESFELALPSWIPREEIVALLGRHRDDTVLFGDVYAKS